MCAYAHHAHVLGGESDAVYAGVESALDFLATNPADMNALLERAMALGQLNLQVMEMLDGANTGTFGAPEPSAVRVTPVKGKAILVSGHDLKDLVNLLEQTKDTGINIYTHGEMLPAHGYPKLKAYPHLAGNYGGAWQDQQTEFADFPGAILMTSNCIIEPRPQYRQRIFTAGPVAGPACATSPTAISPRSSKRPRRCPASRKTSLKRPSPSASATMRCWAWPTKSSTR